jgi:hypothetical protein
MFVHNTSIIQLSSLKSSFKWHWLFGIVFISMMDISIAQTKKTKQSTVDFGVVLNEDGDFAFLSPDPVKAKQLLELNVAAHAALGINTYTFSIGAGSDVLYYNTKVASPYGWRQTSYELKDSNWAARIKSARSCIAAGVNAVLVAGKEAKRNGMRFIPSLRMNDSHFMTDPYNYPLTGKFWIENGERLKIGKSPLAFSKDYGNLFDYTQKEVRDFRFAVFEEALLLHQEIIDGFELDFNRVQVFFPREKNEEGMKLMTALVRKMRNRLNLLAKQKGRPMHLFVRVPPSTAACYLAGLDINAWIKEGLIDLVTPSQLMTLAHDMPIEDMIALGKQHGVQVYPSLFPRTSFRKAMMPGENGYGMDLPYGRIANLAELLGAANNYRMIGAKGFYLFNFKGGDKDEGIRPHLAWMYALVAGLKNDKLNTGDKVYAITKSYYNDEKQPSYAYVKQLPRQLKGEESFELMLGENLANAVFPLKSCVLRIGVRDSVPIQIKLNDVRLPLFKVFTEEAYLSGKKLPPDLANHTLIYLINDPGILKKGINALQVSGAKTTITDIEMGFSYFNQLDLFMLGKKLPAINQLGNN